MKAIKPPTNDQPAAVSPETRLTLNARFSPEMLVLTPNATSLAQLKALIRKLEADRDRLQASFSATRRTDDVVPVPALATPSVFPVSGKVRFYKNCASCTGGGVWRVRW